ncbi:UNVERIFIED_CONTAM: hypothetical protein FKN15_020751 [Acipenser sinensis]
MTAEEVNIAVEDWKSEGIGSGHPEKEELWNLDHPNNSHIPCSPQDKKCLLRHQAKIREQGIKNGKMKNNGNREENKPLCLPALDGQRGKCWCVDQKTGIRLVGTPEVKGELDCHQFIESIRE